jgi:phospholipase A-2-activating protein
MIWRGTEFLQSIPHPKCVWAACELPRPSGGSDFATCGHDGMVRIFSASPERIAVAGETAQVLQMEMEAQVQETALRNKKGPSAEEISKAAKWEDRAAHRGKSDGQVMVFNKEGHMIAAQWLDASGAWLEIGEVTGSGDGGQINGVFYDHVMPVEIDQPGGLGARTLQLGYNNMESPFDAAQRFIDQNSLGQHYLRQIADWIVSRTGQSAPTLDMAGGSGASSSSTSGGAAYKNAAPSAPQYSHFPLRANLNFDDIPSGFQSKIVPKIKEFNAQETGMPLSELELNAVEAVIGILVSTSYYHSSTISQYQLQAILCMCGWSNTANLFPAFDLLRLVTQHPQGSKALAQQAQLGSAINRALQMIGTDPISSVPANTLLCFLRFLCNSFRFEDLRITVLNAVGLVELVAVLRQHAKSTNKNVRLAVATLAMNLSLALHARRSNRSSSATVFSRLTGSVEDEYAVLIPLLTDLLVGEGESVDVLYRVVVAVGTIAVLGGAASAKKLAASGFQQQPLQALKQKWGSKLNAETAQCIDEAVNAVSTLAR